MTRDPLGELGAEASRIAETMFRPGEQLMPHILAEQPDGKLTLVATSDFGNPREELAFRVGLPQLLRAAGAVRTCFFSEAWSSEYEPGEDAQAELPITRPDRIEVVAFSAEDQAGRTCRAMRPIWRSGADGKLLPLVFKQDSRFVMG